MSTFVSNKYIVQVSFRKKNYWRINESFQNGSKGIIHLVHMQNFSKN